MIGSVLALVGLAAFAAAGIAVLRRVAPFLGGSEYLAYGTALGSVGASLALLALASLFGLSAGLVIVLEAACLALAAWLVGVRQPRPDPARFARALVGRLRGAPFASVALAILVSIGAVFWSRALTTDSTGMWAGHRNLWADWAQHLGDVASFVWGENFPPTNPRFPGAPLNYHYLASVTGAALVELGLDPASALCLHSFVFSVVVVLAVHAFARRLGLGPGAASFAVVLLLLGGGLGFWHEWTRVSGSLWDRAALDAANFRWLNVYFALIVPQRGWLYGIPLGLLVLSLLDAGLAERRSRHFLVAGVVAGLLPFAHLGTLLALALLGPFLVLAFPRREWFLFAASCAVIGLPQVIVQQAGGAGAAGALRWAPGWVAPPDPWFWFWIKNLGLFLPLLLMTFVLPGLVAPRSRRLLLAFQPLFVLANLLVFQPWDWDNTKVLVWWYLASCMLVAALLAKLWQLRPRPVLRPLVALVVVSLTLSGVLETANTLLGRDRHRLLSAEEIDLARRVRAETDPASLFVVGLQHNHPVPVLSGRRVLMGYPGWLWSQGIDYASREREIRAIFALGPDSEALIERHGVDYVVVGPVERERFGADPAAWRARFPQVIASESYEVFRTRDAGATVTPVASPASTDATRAPRGRAESR